VQRDVADDDLRAGGKCHARVEVCVDCPRDHLIEIERERTRARERVRESE
jgi:hypothetical protein